MEKILEIHVRSFIGRFPMSKFVDKIMTVIADLSTKEENLYNFTLAPCVAMEETRTLPITDE